MSLIFSRFALLAAAIVPAALLSGCSMGSIALSGPEAAETPVHGSLNLSGTVHGGQNPVTGSAIQLYTVGTGGYGLGSAALLNAGGVGSVAITNGGIGYTSAPTVFFSGGNTTTPATATSLITQGVASVTVTAGNGGSGYASAPAVTFTVLNGGGGSGATGTAILGTGASAGKVIGVTINSYGSGYSIPPTVAFVGSSTTTASGTANLAGTVSSINISSPGSNYLATPSVSFSASGGSGATATATVVPATGVVTDANGNFSVTGDFTCPIGNPSSMTYIVASGGNPGLTAGTNNTAIELIAPLGACNALGASTTVFIDEVTTVATVFALEQFMHPGTVGTGASSFTPNTFSVGSATGTQSKLGLVNAFATISNLVNPANGTANTANTAKNAAAGTNLAANTVVTITPETSKINTIANILASCVNSAGPSSSTCSLLFSSAIPPASASVTNQPGATFSTPADIVQAAYYMATNPNSGPNGLGNMGSLMTLNSSTGAPFQPSLSTTPTDWTLGISYSSAASCSNSSSTTFIGYMSDVGVDASGDVWLDNGSASATTNEMSPVGVPMACSGVIGASRGGATIDTNGNVWSASGATSTASVAANVYEFAFDGTSFTTYPVPTTGATPYAIRADGSGNVFFTDAGNGELYEIPHSTGIVTAIGGLAAQPYGMAIDSKETVVVGNTGSGGTVYAFAPTLVGGTTYPAAATVTTQTAYYNGVYGLAFDSSDRFWVSNSNSNPTTSATQLQYVNSTAGQANTINYIPVSTTQTAGSAGGMVAPKGVAIDGAGNVWMPNSSPGVSSVSEFSNTGAVLSASSGYVKTSVYFNSARGIAIDPSGNVWVSNTGTATNGMTEIVGAAVPVVTPLSAAISTGKLGSTP